jgi:hypothetical protein
MAAILAYHHCCTFNGVLADKYGNDPFVWVQPFLWSHCHARSRPKTFGAAKTAPFVRGRDAVFFVTHHPRTKVLVCDCVFVIDKVVPIAAAEACFPVTHPARHFHFDQSRNPHHKKSSLTRLAHTRFSFVLDPPMPIGRWINDYVRKTNTCVETYFRSKRIKNVRIIVKNADALYNRTLRWGNQKMHRVYRSLPIQGLVSTVPPLFPGTDLMIGLPEKPYHQFNGRTHNLFYCQDSYVRQKI